MIIVAPIWKIRFFFFFYEKCHLTKTQTTLTVNNSFQSSAKNVQDTTGKRCWICEDNCVNWFNAQKKMSYCDKILVKSLGKYIPQWLHQYYRKNCLCCVRFSTLFDPNKQQTIRVWRSKMDSVRVIRSMYRYLFAHAICSIKSDCN